MRSMIPKYAEQFDSYSGIGFAHGDLNAYNIMKSHDFHLTGVINALILDYLTVEGYPNAAAKFSKEANLQPQQDESFIRSRQEIQNCIHGGNIQSAIEMLNELDPEILDSEKSLHFSLLRLQLVELIRACYATGADISPALQFATEHLGPRAPTNPKFLEELEKTMALLLFPPEALEPQLAALLNPELRRVVADSVNRAILERQSMKREAAIRRLVKMRAWAESAARSRACPLPERLELGLTTDDAPQRRINPENGHEPMVTV
ncbi:CTLH domain-containing protein [Cordyceps militaris CM01]|uniref:CTLH domain-containing protein n=1 Tax=Cordyceps militaris (strain CM01) TaxID=983644 RepID=G3J3Y5_CORMM|nr:CTLH domain-containing protein [Cordyceps militaris CM01]EGX95760.1 CTLH domain-containing protein [Cordyceps militaris CM01]